MFEEYGYLHIIPTANNIDDAINVYRKYYTQDKEKQFGVIAIHLE